jgi:peptidyl-dipeptidase Dcp
MNEYNMLQGFALGMKNENFTLMPWDWSYYSEKLKDVKFKVNDEMTRPYFELKQSKDRSVWSCHTALWHHI